MLKKNSYRESFLERKGEPGASEPIPCCPTPASYTELPGRVGGRQAGPSPPLGSSTHVDSASPPPLPLLLPMLPLPHSLLSLLSLPLPCPIPPSLSLPMSLSPHVLVPHPLCPSIPPVLPSLISSVPPFPLITILPPPLCPPVPCPLSCVPSSASVHMAELGAEIRGDIQWVPPGDLVGDAG